LRAQIALEDAQRPAAVFERLNANLAKKSKSSRRRFVRYAILGINALLVFGVLGFVLLGQRSGSASPEKVLAASTDKTQVDPLDQVSSADIAVNVARISGLQESRKVVEDADSADVMMSLPPASTSIVSKPAVVTTALKSKKDIQRYTTVSGDTVTSIAAKFNITSDSIRWSNNLNSNTIPVGDTLWLPPAGDSGIVYVVKSGDTPDSLAAKFKASKDEIVATNDAELSPLKPGERILIPGGTVTAPVVKPVIATAGFGWGSGPVYGGNLYTYGYCTWYVANRVRVPNNWGNANTWDNGAAASGWIVSSIPRVGAIAQSDRGSEGHVAYVEAVSADGTQIKYSDMNGLAGWGRVGYSDWVVASHYEHYIYQ
jgi:surface antigen